MFQEARDFICPTCAAAIGVHCTMLGKESLVPHVKRCDLGETRALLKKVFDILMDPQSLDVEKMAAERLLFAYEYADSIREAARSSLLSAYACLPQVRSEVYTELFELRGLVVKKLLPIDRYKADDWGDLTVVALLTAPIGSAR